MNEAEQVLKQGIREKAYFLLLLPDPWRRSFLLPALVSASLMRGASAGTEHYF